MRQDLGRRAAGIALAIGPCLALAPALALAGEVTAAQIHGVVPGMSQAEAHAALTAGGFMMVPGSGSQMGSISDVTDVSGRIVGSIFGYGKTGSEEFISVEIGPDAAGSLMAYRVTSMRTLGEGESEATLEPMVATTFGAEPNCMSAEAGMVYHYGEDMRQLSQADCSVSPLLIMGAMGEDALDLDWEQIAPRSAALALTSGPEVNLIVVLQDNVLAAEVQGLAGEGATPDGTAMVASAETPDAEATAPSFDAPDTSSAEIEDEVAVEASALPPLHVPASVPGDNAIEIMGVTLGMPLGEILEILAAKGFKPTLDGFQINRNKPASPEHGIVFDDFTVTGIAGRSDFSMRPTMTTYLRTDDGQSMTIGSSWNDDVFNLTYAREFPKDGPYGDGVEIRKMLFSRGPGAPTARDPGHDSGRKYAFWLMDRNNVPREAECVLRYCGNDWILSADGLWDRAERGEDLDDLDYRTYHIDISLAVEDGKQLVTDFQVIMTDPSAAVPAIQEAYRELKASTAPETTSIEF